MHYLEAILNGIVFLVSFSACSLLVDRKNTDFLMLILCPDILLKAFIKSKNYLVES
jgi:hypothetical protein